FPMAAILEFDGCLDHGDGGELGKSIFAGKAAVPLKPADVGGEHTAALLDAAMALVDIAVNIEAGERRIGEEALDLGLEARLVFLYGQQQIRHRGEMSGG